VIALAAGLAVLLLVMLGGRWFATTPPAQILRTGRWAGVVLLAVLAILLVVTGRLGWALAALGGAVSWLVRLVQARSLLRMLGGMFGGTGTAAGQRSKVETRFLRMALDHDTGLLDGDILDGPFAGRRLSGLSFIEVQDLYRHVAADPQSAQLLEAWMRRTWPDWDANRDAGGERGGGGSASAAMTRKEALDVLGLSEGADAKAVHEAHRRLMGLLHPDRGGSNYLAAKINQAKDQLLSGKE
jgi:hypothetical protein